MAKKKDNVWLLETFRPNTAYFLDTLNPKQAERVEAYETGTLEEKFPVECKRIAHKTDPTPSKLAPLELKDDKQCYKYVADEDGTMEIDNEEDAIRLYRVYKDIDSRTFFNEKYGLQAPTVIKREIEAQKRLEAEQARQWQVDARPRKTVII